MIISDIYWKNFKSWGNNTQQLKLKTDTGELILMVGKNGSGKCVEKNTFIDIEINDIELNYNFIKFLDTTDTGKKILIYIKNNNLILYEKIKKYRSTL